MFLFLAQSLKMVSGLQRWQETRGILDYTFRVETLQMGSDLVVPTAQRLCLLSFLTRNCALKFPRIISWNTLLRLSNRVFWGSTLATSVYFWWFWVCLVTFLVAANFVCLCLLTLGGLKIGTFAEKCCYSCEITKDQCDSAYNNDIYNDCNANHLILDPLRDPDLMQDYAFQPLHCLLLQIICTQDVKVKIKSTYCFLFVPCRG
jgi:hypothetical protein